MAHFEILENFTKVPNEVFLIIKFVKNSSYIVLIHIVRKTIGYNKKSDGISISQFVEATGLSASQVSRAIKELKELKIIKVTRQTQKNGGKSYNRYEVNHKGINTLLSSRHKGTVTMTDGVLSSRHKGTVTMTDTKDNRQNTIEQKKRERLGCDFLYFEFSDSLRAKQTDKYLEHLVASSGYIKSETAFKIAIKKKLNREDKEQLQDFEEWYLDNECTRLLEEYKGDSVVYKFSYYEIESIYPYFRTEGYSKDNIIYMKIINEEGSEILGFNSNTNLEEFIKRE